MPNQKQATPETNPQETASAETMSDTVEEGSTQPSIEDATKALENEILELKDQLLRKVAEFDNFRKRTQKEKEDIYPRAKADAVEKFVPIIDNFERALATTCSDPEFKKGIDMIYHNFTEVIAACGVEQIGAEGETFDPNMHNAVMHEEDPTKGEGVVSQVLQKGYKIGDKVIRYAMVKVAN